jgi:hypothetical protein
MVHGPQRSSVSLAHGKLGDNIPNQMLKASFIDKVKP